jgi:hypothetical protein
MTFVKNVWSGQYTLAKQYWLFLVPIETKMKSKFAASAAFVVGLLASAAPAFSTGSGVVVGPHEVLTAAHVVKGCTPDITVRSSLTFSTGYVVARDETNDLAVVHTKNGLPAAVSFRDGPVRAGDQVIALGYPLQGLLATTPSLTVGNVNALRGIEDDSRFLQFSAPIQPGNSGGPLLNDSGHLVGIVTSKLNALKILKITGDIPENVNFALKTTTVRTFLDSNGFTYQIAGNERQMSPADVGDMARPFTVQIECNSPDVEANAAPPPSPAPAPSVPDASTAQPPKHPFRVVDASDGSLNIRNGPGPTYQEIAKMPLGATALVGRCVTPEGGWKPFCEVEWQGVRGWASSCCMAELFSYRVTQNLTLRSGPDKSSWNLLTNYAPDYVPEGAIFTWENRPDASICSVGRGGEIWCQLTYTHDGGIRTGGWVSAHFLRSTTNQMLLACLFQNPDPNCNDDRAAPGFR